MKIRNAVESDLVHVAPLMQSTQEAHVAAFPHRYRPMDLETIEQVLREELRRDGATFAVVEEGGEVLGYAIFETVEVAESPVLKGRRYCYLRQIGTAPNARGRGVGAALLEHLRASAHHAGIDEIELDVWAFNDRARRFFERAGFARFATKMRFQG